MSKKSIIERKLMLREAIKTAQAYFYLTIDTATLSAAEYRKLLRHPKKDRDIVLAIELLEKALADAKEHFEK